MLEENVVRGKLLRNLIIEMKPNSTFHFLSRQLLVFKDGSA